MKKNIIIGLLSVLLSYQLAGQNTNFNFLDKHNYFLVDRKVYDVRTFKQIVNAPIGQKMPLISHDKKQVLIDYEPGLTWSTGSLTIMDKKGTKKYSNYVHYSAALISYERSGILSVRENDLWYTPINLETGTLLTPKRLTSLGIFQSGIPMFHWYGDNILINADNSCYAINLDNNQMTHLPFLSGSVRNPIQAYFNYSPSGRFIICPFTDNVNEPMFYFDMKTLKQRRFANKLFPSFFNYSGPDGYYITWISDNEMIFWNGRSNSADPENEQSFYLCDLQNNRCKLIGQVRDVKDYVVNYDTRKFRGKIANTISNDTTFMAVPFLIRGQGNEIIDEYVNFYNMKKSVWITPKIPIQPSSRVMMTADQELVFAWISANKLIYKQSGGIEKQGTWLFDIEKNEKIKLTSFQTESILPLTEAGYTLFVANNHLFRIKNDGTGFQQLTAIPLRDINLTKYAEPIYDNSKWLISNHIERIITNNGNNQSPSIPIGRFVFISNGNQRINVENGLAASLRKDGDWSAHWIFKQVPNTNFYWIENRWKSSERLHMESEILKSEEIKDDAWSAHWYIIPNSDGFTIQNRWRAEHKIYIRNGKIACGPVPQNTESAKWLIKLVD